MGQRLDLTTWRDELSAISLGLDALDALIFLLSLVLLLIVSVGLSLMLKLAIEERTQEVGTLRAIGKKSAFGEQVSHTSWLMHEYNTLTKLHAAGASVPKPYATTENAILMRYYGDGVRGASTLSETTLSADEAEPLFHEAMRNIEVMLQNGMIHGDLSAYNILYHDGQIVLIDFPQVVETSTNYSAAFILERDVTRVCEYFTLQGVDCNASQIVQRLTKEYLKVDMEKLKADQSRAEYQEEEDDPDDWY